MEKDRENQRQSKSWKKIRLLAAGMKVQVPASLWWIFGVGLDRWLCTRESEVQGEHSAQGRYSRWVSENRGRLRGATKCAF